MGYEFIDVGSMNADYTYQRVPDETRLSKMASAWDDDKANIVHISRRRNGTNWVIDGNHTRLACEMAKGKDHKLLCNIHTGLSVPEEAELFVELNKSQKKPSYNEKLKASLAAGDPIVKGYFDAVEKAGLKCSLTNSAGKFRAHNSLMSIYKNTSPDLFVRSVKTAVCAVDGRNDFLKTGFFTGICFAITKHPEIDDKRMISIVRKTPAGKISDIANLYRNGAIGGGLGVNIYFGKAYIDLYNKGLKKNKIAEE